MYAGLHLSPAPALSLTWTLSIALFHRLCAPLKFGITFSFQASHLLCPSVLLHRYIRSRNSCIHRNTGAGGEKKDPASRLSASLIKQQDVRPRLCVSQCKSSRVFWGQGRSYSYRGKKKCGGGGVVLFHLCEDS